MGKKNAAGQASTKKSKGKPGGTSSSTKAAPKSSDSTEGRSKKASGHMRSASTVKRLQMYKGGKIQDSKGGGKVQPFQRKDTPNTRVVPDRRWFGNTRTVGQNQLQQFRQQVAEKQSDPYAVLLKEKKLPLGLVKQPEKGKERRAHVLRNESFEYTFGPKAQRKRPRPPVTDEDNVSQLFERVKRQQQEYETRQEADDPSSNKHKDTYRDDANGASISGERDSARSIAFYKGQSKRIWTELYRVIDSSDVVVQVLDARDPNGTRSAHLEHHIKQRCSQKHMVILLNKCDLVPAWATRKWLFYLSRSFPTLAFHASVTNPFGKGAMLSLLRQFGRLRKDRQSISVGFVGYPNVGKSSVINTLQSKKVCGVAPVPGETKVWQFLTLTKRVLLIDCPGVVYHREGDSDTDAVLKGVVRVTDLEDATEHVPEVLRRIKPRYLQRAYQVKSWTDAEDFLAQLARRSGKLLKGGEPDMNTAAKTLLLDWQKGKIPFFEVPDDEEFNKLKTEEQSTAASSSAPTDSKGVDAQSAARSSRQGPTEESDPVLAARAAEASKRQISRTIPVKPSFFDGDDEESAQQEQVTAGWDVLCQENKHQQSEQSERADEDETADDSSNSGDDEVQEEDEEEEAHDAETAAQNRSLGKQADEQVASRADESEEEDGGGYEDDELTWESVLQDIGK